MPREDFRDVLRVQIAAAVFRRSQVQIPLDEEERRIFEAVVRPDRVKANGEPAMTSTVRE